MPLFNHYSKQIKECRLADVNNIGTGGRAGGSCTAAAFLRVSIYSRFRTILLRHFVKHTKLCLFRNLSRIRIGCIWTLLASCPTKKKFLNFMDRVAKSHYFRRVTETKFVKRAMQQVSNTRIVLSLEVSQIVGTMTLNIPPPPTDRLW